MGQRGGSSAAARAFGVCEGARWHLQHHVAARVSKGRHFCSTLPQIGRCFWRFSLKGLEGSADDNSLPPLTAEAPRSLTVLFSRPLAVDVTSRPRRRVLVVVVVALLVGAFSLTACDPAAGPPPYLDSSAGIPGRDRGWFAPGSYWTGDFGDPQVVRVGSTYFTYASPIGGRALPVLSSTDLVHWKVRDRWSTAGPPGAPGYSVFNDPAIPAEVRGQADTGVGPYNESDWGRYDNNDAQVRFTSWGTYDPQGPWMKRTIWASSVAQIGSRWFSYSAVKVSNSSDDPQGSAASA